MKRFVVFSDLHLHPWAYGSQVINGKNSRLEQQKEVVKSIAQYCKERDIPEVVFTGDLFHTSTVGAETNQAAYEAFNSFKEHGIDLSLLVGNHDQSSRSGGSHALSFFREFGNVFDVGRHASEAVHSGPHRLIAGTPAYFFPYTDDEATLKGYLRSCGGDPYFLFLHQGVGGVEVNAKGFTLNEILTPAMVPSVCAMAFSGHYHTFKPVSSNLIIPGSTVQLNWGDEGEPRGWLDVSVEHGQVQEINFIESQASKFITIHEDDLDTHTKETPLPNLHGNFVRVITEGAYSPEELSKLLLEGFGSVSCEVKPAVRQNASIEKAKNITVASLNEVVYSFANSREKAGIISAYDKEVGEQLLKGSYQVPQI